MRKDYDFSGWATKNNLLCQDGRTIRSGAFKDQNGMQVPLVWNHGHKDPTNVLGHAILENRKEGVYAYCKFNKTPKAQHIKEAVKNGDLNGLSIYANGLVQKDNGYGTRDVLHGAIREVSLVLAGANPGATIDTVLAHSGDVIDGFEVSFDEDGGIICSGEPLALYHSEEPEDDEDDEEDIDDSEDDEEEEDDDVKNADSLSHAAEENDKTVEDVFNELTDEQKNVVYFMIGEAVKNANGSNDEEEENDVKHNAFEDEEYLEHNGVDFDFDAVIADAKRIGSLKESFLAHADAMGLNGDELMHADDPYGITDIDYLFPEYKSLNTPPEWVSRNMDWVRGVLDGVHHTPFSRIKSMFADITEDDARARGYMKGNLKKEEVFTLLKRTTDPQTIYKKQKLDRDDVIDITDFDVVAWIKAEMRMMLDEEIARAILVGDGRLNSSDDKIKQEHVRSIYLDDDFYSIKVPVKVSANATDEEKAKALINAAIKARKDYKGSGNLTFYTTADVLTDGLLLEDGIGHKLYKSEAELATAMRMTKIVEVEVMEGQTREGADHKVRPLLGIAVNLKDYTVGADKGGAVSMFDDFDIDYNQMKYLIETRMSGALIKPKSALVFELDQAAANGSN